MLLFVKIVHGICLFLHGRSAESGVLVNVYNRSGAFHSPLFPLAIW